MVVNLSLELFLRKINEEYELAHFMHEEYEKNAAAAGRNTQKKCQVGL